VTAHGIVPGIPDETYHADRDRFSQSAAKVLLTSPAKYRHWRDNPPPPKAAFDLGHVVHALVLGVGAGYVAIPADLLDTRGGLSRKDGKAWVKKQRAAGLIPLKGDVLDGAKAMADAVLTHPGARVIFEAEGDVEVSFYWTARGVECKGRADKLAAIHDGLAVVDLKSARDASPGGFARDAAKFDYRIQGGSYSDALGTITGEDHLSFPVVFVAVETEPPHLVGLYSLAPWDVDAGRQRWHDALDLLTQCRATSEWPGYATEIVTLDLPPWAA
jgi:hypothetical protein